MARCSGAQGDECTRTELLAFQLLPPFQSSSQDRLLPGRCSSDVGVRAFAKFEYRSPEHEADAGGPRLLLGIHLKPLAWQQQQNYTMISRLAGYRTTPVHLAAENSGVRQKAVGVLCTSKPLCQVHLPCLCIRCCTGDCAQS